MVSNLDELITDINRFETCEIDFYKHTGPDLEMQTYKYNSLVVQKDNNGRAWINDEFYISDKYKIIKVKDRDSTERAVYQIVNGSMKLMSIYLF